jgi:hypothetical protein
MDRVADVSSYATLAAQFRVGLKRKIASRSVSDSERW